MAIKRVREPFMCVMDGTPRVYTAGQLVDDSDPAIKGRERLFEDVEAHVEAKNARVEQATAAPGEKRAVSRPQRPVRPRGKGKEDKTTGEGQ